MSKYHNFKIEGIGYVSKCGHDSNPGTDPNAPSRTQKSLGQTMSNATVFGAGVYSIGYTLFAAKGDGKVIIKPATEGTWFSCSGNHNYHNLEMWYPDFNQNISTTGGTDNFDCIIRYGKGVTGSSSITRSRRFTRCVFFDSSMGENLPSGSSAIMLLESIAVRSNIYMNNYSQIHDSYIGPNCNLIALYSSGPFDGYFRNNNIQGKIILEGKSYEVKRKKNGTPADNTDPTIADISTYISADGTRNYSDFYTWGNFNEAPKFADAAGEDFTLQADSPHIRAARDGFSNIGGTKVSTSVKNTDDLNLAGTRVIASPEINTSVPLAYQLNNGQTEGFVDYIFYNSGLTITNLGLTDVFSFDSDFAGGTTFNKNVPDAEPVTVDYARLTSTTAANANLNQITVSAGTVAIGQHVRVLGQCREVIGVSGGVLTLNANLLAAVGSGVDVTYGTAAQLAAINPNRLTVLMRTRSASAAPSVPLVDSEWDNELDSSYGVAGRFFNQEINTKPGFLIDGATVYGYGNSEAPVGLPLTELAPQWVNVRVYKRNNYSSKGLV